MALTLHDLPNDVDGLKVLLLSTRAENARIDAECQRLEGDKHVLAVEVDRLTAQNERLDHIVSVLRRAQFGRRSERIDDSQITLALEDVETRHGVEDAAAEKTSDIVKREGVEARRANRGHLPAHLAREEVVIEPEAKARACCRGCALSARTSRSASTSCRHGCA